MDRAQKSRTLRATVSAVVLAHAGSTFVAHGMAAERGEHWRGHEVERWGTVAPGAFLRIPCCRSDTASMRSS